nr:tumor necrosis factor receptor superfamily member 4 isoform X1 [Pogona vitticeps]
MASTLVLAAAFALLLRCTARGSGCARDQYPLGHGKCCKKCPPGSELEKRCTFRDDTLCVPCEEHSYNADFTEKRCKRCAVCERERGLQEVKPCDRLSNTHCMCLPGYEEVANQASREDDKRCEPCPAGSFSKGGKEKCRPWTNCTAKDLKLLRPGKREEDTICEEQASGLSEPSPTVALPTSFKDKHSTWTTAAPTRFYGISLVIHPKTETTSDKSGIFIVVVVLAVMLFVAGGVGLLYFQKAGGKKSQRRPGALSDVPREDGRNSYRIPIQEEQMDHKASLAQN